MGKPAGQWVGRVAFWRSWSGMLRVYGLRLPNGTDLRHVAGSFLFKVPGQSRSRKQVLSEYKTANKNVGWTSPALRIAWRCFQKMWICLPASLVAAAFWTRPTGGLSFGWESCPLDEKQLLGVAIVCNGPLRQRQSSGSMFGSASKSLRGKHQQQGPFLSWHCCGLSLRGTLKTSSIRAKTHRYAQCPLCPVKCWQLRRHGFLARQFPEWFSGTAGCHIAARKNLFSKKPLLALEEPRWATTSGESCGSRTGAVEKVVWALAAAISYAGTAQRIQHAKKSLRARKAPKTTYRQESTESLFLKKNRLAWKKPAAQLNHIPAQGHQSEGSYSASVKKFKKIKK